MKFVREIPTQRVATKQCLVKTDDGTQYFIVSSITGELFLSAPETLAFRANAAGKPENMQEVAGGPHQSREGVIGELAVMFEGATGETYWNAHKPLKVTIGIKLPSKGRKFR